MNQESDPEGPDPGAPSPDPGQLPDDVVANNLTFMLILFEGLLGIVALFGGWWTGLDWTVPFRWDPEALALGAGAGVIMFLLNGLLLLPGGNKNPLHRWVYRPFHRRFLRHFRTLNLEDITLVSVMSGLCEELLFRAWLQARYGIVIASVMFGAVHIWGKEGIGYGCYAVGMGFFLGGVFMLSGGNLWAVAAAHGLNNFLGLLAIHQGWFPALEQAGDRYPDDTDQP